MRRGQPQALGTRRLETRRQKFSQQGKSFFSKNNDNRKLEFKEELFTRSCRI